ncbi:MAG: hypothetical protein ABIH67_04745 [Candidatus Uhrbacteria bacterium]
MDQDNALQQVLDTVEFIKDNAASKDDLHELESHMTSKDDLSFEISNLKGELGTEIKEVVNEAKSEIITQVDGFISLHNKLETELIALQSKYERLESQLQQIAQHVQLELR